MENSLINKSSHWGISTTVDLYQCNPDKIRSKKAVKEFVIALCDFIEMTRFGEPIIVDFGSKPEIAGITLMQMIETSNITAHFANHTNNAYIDVFSCKDYDSDNVADFCQKFFDAKQVRHRASKRY
jgi:S-adenosylmethionine/arginine decarboxylase-like enzyme